MKRDPYHGLAITSIAPSSTKMFSSSIFSCHFCHFEAKRGQIQRLLNYLIILNRANYLPTSNSNFKNQYSAQLADNTNCYSSCFAATSLSFVTCSSSCFFDFISDLFDLRLCASATPYCCHRSWLSHCLTVHDLLHPSSKYQPRHCLDPHPSCSTAHLRNS